MKISQDALPQIQRVGECSVLIELSEHITPEISTHVNALVHTITKTLQPAPINYTPSYTSVLLEFSALHFDWVHIQKQLNSLLAKSLHSTTETTRPIIEVPVYYAASVALDAKRYQTLTGLTLSEIAALHTSVTYQVYALGFSPGFAFMAEVPTALQLPRLDAPRAQVPKGSVAIAGPQTAIYPQTSPGGWNVIGRTPSALYTPNSQPMTLLSAGDSVRFVSITQNEFKALGGDI
ncbi:5-oxoprolinase subunit PxpB [Vibrio ezurae]|uniref:Putative allophanate hydrolase n=1 Tax=Vibrio ezurae NBRC 102218 TaxID=1219080 RepID=U3AJH8_9VIBR|nr:5-oxoprolinase subunit PxpB [Vibrio ezurae]GAD80086.1 putative allophanate hydrolase [Vibrio ezurae NBRC 102218]